MHFCHKPGYIMQHLYMYMYMGLAQNIKITMLTFGPRREKTLFSVDCEQQRCRPACTSAQTDQRLCYTLIGKYI